MALVKRNFSFLHKLPQIGARMTSMLLLMLVLFQAPLYFAITSPDWSGIPEFSRRLAIFSTNVYTTLVANNANQNIIFSPFSIQTCAAMARMGAKGNTAAQLDRGLKLISNNNAKIADSFHEVLATYEKSSILHIANKIYIKTGYQLRDEFSSLVSKKFLSAVEPINFENPKLAADQINSWVALRTNNLIKDIVSPSILSSDTRLLLINAIHFKGNWVHQFPEINTWNQPFYLNDAKSIRVPIMTMTNRLKYANLPALEAAALELPYKDSDLSMLIVLPNSKTGLPQLERKLLRFPISRITKALHFGELTVHLPKFKTEFNLELTETFKKLGMTDIFTNRADLSRMLKSPETLQVSKIIHKAFIEVNEIGTEAAAATAMGVGVKMLKPGFIANHPFNYYIVKDHNMVLFAGRLINPTK
ncbi:serine protease inhibitor 42Dd-like isoform X3 [Drosophila sulfurigaster albostrigata]|uniref:serine protease inhibitor 42Dd-like isoform X3 n=1 Tax=Drosophila sulfurigaster albostrigata TaxID=89887 RepID=UPI002D21B4DE|nr:serine protease inhibitor 42Dd-like isoform X3 [Drosophila sulfurigaster albostrigata]